jgi:quercetin dioxygenase-like cupin family protein
MLINIEDKEKIVYPGDAWYQPENTIHHTVGLEDSIWLEFKTPSEEPYSI